LKNPDQIQLIQKGDKNAFDELFLFYYKKLCRFALVFLHDEDESEEAVQRMFVRFWENRRKLIIPENLRSYLFKSTYNECLKTIRSQTNRKKYHQNYYSNLIAESVEEDRPALDQITPYLNKAIANLPERCRQIFILHKVEGMKQKEVAEILNISAKTVENQVAIAITKLRAELKPYLHLLPAGLIFLNFLSPN
jgi:RNA polymerase sigma-70 factor (ECF subfamily)